jgi:hypothetical protein
MSEEAEVFIRDFRTALREGRVSPQEAQELRQYLAGGLKRCGACDALTDGLGFFKPNEAFSRRMGRQHGGLIIFPVCDDCYEKPDTVTRVEAVILRESQVN